ncbi:hypothetical protein [Marinibacterium profundimaris]|uniref:HTH marR-type domain-containing protein n=1 Tax=Marinibacterium profundimaris TaxID=1679460 RepID=A0A225NM43_9RHOB|nr:hypothetical protein [Marinibacterium profundimaris]OWU74644.1 hypothetical protein ATO3_08410 [Marinibacterium profundimaris]
MSDIEDPRIAVLAEGVIRSTRLMRALGLDGLGLALAIAFHDATRPWTARALADYIAFPRTSVLKRLREYQDLGVLRKTGDGWEVYPEPQLMLRKMLSEYIDLLGGDRVGFSPEVLDFCKGTSEGAVRPARRRLDMEEAQKICFPAGTSLLNLKMPAR